MTMIPNPEGTGLQTFTEKSSLTSSQGMIAELAEGILDRAVSDCRGMKYTSKRKNRMARVG